jgi:O-antigen/teichoic acid export membrane protein
MTLATGEPEAAAGRRERRTRSLRSAATRLATVGDQLLVALTNFGLTIAIGRAFGADELAAYGIGLSVGLMVQGLQRHAVTIPLMLHPAGWVRGRKAAIAGEQMLMLLPALLVGLLALFAASWSSGFLQLIVLSSAVCLLIYLQLEFARAFLVKLEKPGLLLAGAAFYAAVAAALAIAALRGLVGYDTLLISLAAAMVVHACAVAAVGGGVALKDGSRLLAADMKRYGGWALAATGTYAGYNHAPLLILGAVAAPVHAAVFVAARSLMQPLQILLRGLDVADKNAFAELRSNQPAPRFIFRLVILYAAIGIALGAAFAVASDWLLTFAYGQKFAGYGNAVVAWAFAYALISVSMPLESLVYAQNRFAGYFAIRGAASVIAIAAAFPLIHGYSAVGAIAACALGWLVAVAGTGAMLMRSVRR